MTKPKSAAKRAAKPPKPDAETPSGDPELAALVRGDAPPYDAGPTLDTMPVLPVVAAGETPVGDPELAALVRQDAPQGDPELAALVRGDEPPFDAGPVFDAAPVLPLVADGEPPARPRRRRSLVLRFGVAFVVAFLLTVG